MWTAEQFIDELSWGRTELNTTLDGKVRIQGISPDGNVHTVFTLFGVALLPYLWTIAKAPAKILVFLLLVAYAANVIGSSSKAGWLGLVFLLLVYMAIAEDTYKWRMVGGGLLVGVIGFVALSFNSKLLVGLEKITGHTYANTVRVGYALMLWEMVKDHPILGAGTGAFGYEYHRYFPAGRGMVPFDAAPSGNAYMQVWGENGTLGLLCMLGIYGVVLMGLWLGMKNSKTARLKSLGATLIGLFVVTMWSIVVYPIWDSKFLWMTIGLAAAYANLPEVQPEPKHDRPPPPEPTRVTPPDPLPSQA
jgi:O-antigen ligase